MYWLASGIAGLLGLGAAGFFAWAIINATDKEALDFAGVGGVFVLYAVISWLIGRALRYILAGT